MQTALLIWGASVFVVVIIAIILCQKIEASGVRRWGATGSLFSYEKEETK